MFTGAGLSHLMFMPKEAIVIELFQGDSPKHYRNFAKWSGAFTSSFPSQSRFSCHIDRLFDCDDCIFACLRALCLFTRLCFALCRRQALHGSRPAPTSTSTRSTRAGWCRAHCPVVQRAAQQLRTVVCMSRVFDNALC